MMNVRRYCKVNGISHLNEREIESLATEAIMEVGASYGRRLMRGYLLSKGFRISERNISSALKVVDPISYEERRNNSLDRTNPIPYRPRYYGHKLHVDQNEKLILFGVTLVMARDGFSGKIISYGVMPIKNNIAIYDLIYRKALQDYGLWDQIRVDCGREFYLMLFIQEILRQYYGSSDVCPYVQSTSTENMPIERIWSEVNLRVNYPVKRKLISLVDDGYLDMGDETTKFCVSFITCRVVHAGIERFVDAWNEHSIPRLGVPNEIAEYDDYITVLPQDQIPSVEDATEYYESQGGHLRIQSNFGVDPLAARLDLILLRDQLLFNRLPSNADMFSDVVSGNGYLLQTAILECIEVTNRFTLLI
uniref:Integrase core domain-containing protein n=1 Tax=Amphimedon queenslandica TaxID=400682 RepID=A0A1X7V173_AMPQE